jgi:hypothetical protein
MLKRSSIFLHAKDVWFSIVKWRRGMYEPYSSRSMNRLRMDTVPSAIGNTAKSSANSPATDMARKRTRRNADLAIAYMGSFGVTDKTMR